MPRTTELSANQIAVHRALAKDCDIAWKIIEEYYGAASVVARDAKDECARTYFKDGAGVWLATVGNNAVGCIALRPLPAIADSAEVKRLYVQPRYRGSGVAAALYRALELYAREWGCKSLYLDTTDEMVAAQRLYAALGFKLTPRYNANPQATIFMHKDL